MDYIQAALRGDIEKAAKLSFECIMCGLCVSRCPAEIVHYNVGLLCRRLYSKYMVPEAEDLAKRVEEITKGKFAKEVEEFVHMDKERLKKLNLLLRKFLSVIRKLRVVFAATSAKKPAHRI